MANRKLWILLSLFLLGFTACANLDNSGGDFSVPDEPNIRLVHSRGISDGNQLVSCWTQGEDNVACDVAEEDGQSAVGLAIGADDELAIEFVGKVGKPDNIDVAVKAVADNGRIVTILNPTVGDTFTLDSVPEGEYRLEITGYYDDIGGSAATHSEVFVVTIGESTVVAVNPTATTGGNTVSDDSATATSVVATNEAVSTLFALTAEIAITQTAESTIFETPPTPTPETSSTQEILNQTATALIEQTEVDVATATILPTDTPEPELTATPTEAVTEAPTETPMPEATPTSQGLPTFVPPATRTPIPPGNTGAPQVTLRVSGVDYQPRATTFCEIGTAGSETCSDETVQVDLIQGNAGSAVNFIVSGPRPQRMTYRFLAGQVFSEIDSGERTVPSNTYLFNLVNEPGLYVIEIEIFYENARATYLYQAQIQ